MDSHPWSRLRSTIPAHENTYPKAWTTDEPSDDHMGHSFEPPIDDRPTYWAFISHSHHDRRVARWCKAALEKQRVPRAQRNLIQNGHARLQPIFLDELALSAAPALDSELKKSLDASRSLVVVCSPLATLSHYVNDEIRYFQSIGRGHRIFCLAASGIPNATDDGKPQLECFPAALRTRLIDGVERPLPVPERPLATVLGDETEREKKDAIRQLLGGVLGISDVELRRAELSRTRLRLATGIFVAALAAVLLVAFILPWHTYGKGYVRRKGVWEELSTRNWWSATHGGEHYTFIRRGALGRPTSVLFQDGFGRCPKEGMRDILQQSFANPCNTSRACEARFEYDPKGHIRKEELVDQYGMVLETLLYDGSSVGEFKQGGFTCNQSHSGVGYIKFETYERGQNAGLFSKLKFLSRDSSPATAMPRANNDGAYGLAFEYDDHSRITRITSLGADETPQNNRSGFTSEGLAYDSDGNELGRRYFNPGGEPTLTTKGFAAYANSLDRYGNVLERTYLDLGGRLTMTSLGYATVRYQIGSLGEILKESYFDNTGHAASDASGAFAFESTYDRYGNRTSTTVLDEQDRPTLDKEHISQRRFGYDSNGNVIRTDTFGTSGEKVFGTEGYVTELESYDEHGNPVELRFLDADGKLTPGKGGDAIRRVAYDQHNQVIDVKLFDSQGKPTFGPGEWAEHRLFYDERGNEVASEVYGTDGAPTLQDDGVFRISRQYNDAGLVTEARSLALKGQPAVTNDMGEASVQRYEYDSIGRMIRASFFNASGTPAADSHRVSSLTYAYDPRGNITDRAFFAPDGSPAPNDVGAFAFYQEFDSRGNTTLEEYRDANGNPMKISSGAAAVRIETDRSGNRTSFRYLGLNLEPILATADQIAGTDSAYDEKGNLTSFQYVDLSGHLKNPIDGIARYIDRYSVAGDRIEVRYFDANAQPATSSSGVYGTKFGYDERHREIEETFLDQSGHPMESPSDHYAIRRLVYDERGRVTQQSYFHIDGTAAFFDNMYSIERSSYDDRGNLLNEVLLDQNGQPFNSGHESRIAITYDTYGRQIERRFFGPDGKLFRNPVSGRAVVRTQYDASGRKILELSLDENERPVDRVDKKWFKLSETYAADGSVTLTCSTVNGRTISPCKDN